MKKYSFTSETQVAANISLCWIDLGREKFPFFLLCFRCRVDRFSDQRDWSCSECPPSFPKKKTVFTWKLTHKCEQARRGKVLSFAGCVFFLFVQRDMRRFSGSRKRREEKGKYFPCIFTSLGPPFPLPRNENDETGKKSLDLVTKICLVFFRCGGEMSLRQMWLISRV